MTKPRLIATMGLPRAGKSRVALLSAHILGILPEGLLDTDTLRKEAIKNGKVLYELRYSRESMELVYDMMMALAQERLAEGLDVVMSGTFTNQKRRRELRRLAEQTESELHIFFVDCDEATIEERLAQGIPLKNEGSNGSDLASVFYPSDDSEAGWPVYSAIRKVFTPPENPSLVIDGTKPAEATLQELSSYLLRESKPILAF